MLVVKTESPCIVMAMEGHKVLGFGKGELVGQSILNFLGTKSDAALFQLAIKEVSNFQMNDGQFILYDKNGNDQQLIVSFLPYLQDGLVIGCIIAFNQSEAIRTDSHRHPSRSRSGIRGLGYVRHQRMREEACADVICPGCIRVRAGCLGVLERLGPRDPRFCGRCGAGAASESRKLVAGPTIQAVSSGWALRGGMPVANG